MQRISSEFAAFVRHTGVRAFDSLSERTIEVEARLRPILRAWVKLTNEQKHELFDQLIAVVQSRDISNVAEDASEKPVKRDIRRFAPEEVEPTMPAKKPKARKKSAAKKKPKS